MMPRGWRYTSTETVNRMQTSKEKRLSLPGKILLAPTRKSKSSYLQTKLEACEAVYESSSFDQHENVKKLSLQ